jgi:hypothetical protein
MDHAATARASINVTQDMSEVTLDVVLKALFGDDLARLTEGPGGNPFALLTDDTERNLSFAYKFRQLGATILGDVQRRRRDERAARRYRLAPHRRRGPAYGRADERSPADR